MRRFRSRTIDANTRWPPFAVRPRQAGVYCVRRHVVNASGAPPQVLCSLNSMTELKKRTIRRHQAMAPSPCRQDLAECGNRHGDRGKGGDEFPEHGVSSRAALRGLLAFGRPVRRKGSCRSRLGRPSWTTRTEQERPDSSSLPARDTADRSNTWQATLHRRLSANLRKAGPASCSASGVPSLAAADPTV
jgi:hypothetical protein